MEKNSGKIWVALDRFTTPKLRALTAISGSLSTAVSILFLLILVYPHIQFSGYVEGYASPLIHNVRYTTTGEPIYFVNMGIIRTPTIATFIYVLLLLALSITSLAYLRRSPSISITLLYGTSLSQTITSGVLRYISQAFAIDIGRILSISNGARVIIFRSTAGLVEYIGVLHEETFVYHVVYTNPIILLTLLTLAVATATASTIWLTYIYGKHVAPTTASTKPVVQKPKTDTPKILWPVSTATAVTATALALIIIGASAFAYYPYTLNINPVPPPTKIQSPPTMYCIGITRTSRGAITYTDFEVYPVSGWTNIGGVWSLSTGYRGGGLRGQDDGGGVGGASQYYYNVDLSGYRSLWVSVKTLRDTSIGDTGYYGIVLMNSGRNRAYTVEIYYSTGRLYVWSWNVEAFNGWWSLGSTAIPNYNSGAWYVIVLRYSVTDTAVEFYVWLYDVNGNQVAYLSARSTSANRFTPAYIGVSVDDDWRWQRFAAFFDDFIVSTTDPRFIVFQGTPIGYSVEVWDNTGNLVNRTTATTTTTTSLGVVSDTVVGTGSGGRVIVRFSDGVPCVVYSVSQSDAVLGGDVYTIYTGSLGVSLGVNATSIAVSASVSSLSSVASGFVVFSIHNSDTKAYYARLVLDLGSSLDVLTANISLYRGSPPNYADPAISISEGSVISGYTGWIDIQPSSKINASFVGYLGRPGSSANIRMYLELCTLPNGGGACVYYPVTLSISG